MSQPCSSILRDFQAESKTLVKKMAEILDQCEGNFSQVQSLADFGQTVDRMMGAAQTLAAEPAVPNVRLSRVADCAAICKSVGYKASKIKDNETFYDICVALLQDATEVIEQLVEHLFDKDDIDMKTLFSQTLIDRLKWVSDQFGAEYSGTVDVHQGQETKMNQADIDELLKKLGLD
ncbi:MAG: hypothetical protein ACK5P7_01395 [Bdellovibrio sp.]|jgi:hypothetical protein